MKIWIKTKLIPKNKEELYEWDQILKDKRLFTVVNNYCFVFGHIYFLITLAIYLSQINTQLFFYKSQYDTLTEILAFSTKFPLFKHLQIHNHPIPYAPSPNALSWTIYIF